jgi:hypothetical protein
MNIFFKKECNDILERDVLKICIQQRMKIMNLELENDYS